MNLLRDLLQKSPTRARVLPFFIFLILTAFQGESGTPKSFWLYFAKTVLGLWMILEMRPLVKEMRWAFSWEAVVVGIGVCVIWVGLDPYYPSNHLVFKPIDGESWNPMISSSSNDLLGVWGNSTTDVFVVGSAGTILHYGERN